MSGEQNLDHLEALARELLEYAGNPGYSHNDYADTMRRAADALARRAAPVSAPVAGDAEVALMKALGKAYPIYQGPHTNLADRNDAVRKAFSDGYHAALANQPATTIIPEGWALVPIKPTPKMVDATFSHEQERGGSESHNARNKRIWSAMLSAAGVAPTAAPEQVAQGADERALFEADTLKTYNAATFERGDNGRYDVYWVQEQWDGWQRRAKLSQPSEAAPRIHGDIPAVREFKEWLNERRMADVSLVFHEIVAKYRTALAAPSLPSTQGGIPSKQAVFAIDIMGGPMREYAPGKWENAIWPSEQAPAAGDELLVELRACITEARKVFPYRAAQRLSSAFQKAFDALTHQPAQEQATTASQVDPSMALPSRRTP